MTGHDASEWAVTMGRNTQPLDTVALDKLSLAEVEAVMLRRLKSGAGGDPLENRTLIAILENDKQGAAQGLETMDRRNRLGLHVIKGGQA